jgi:phosphate transport system substrate-binding protein
MSRKSMGRLISWIGIWLPVGIILAGTLACSTTQLTGKITEAGSTNVQPIADKLARAFMDKNQGVTIEIAGGETLAGIQAVNEGAVDIGAASRDLKPDEPKLITHLLGQDGVAILVHGSNVVDSLTQAQVRDIFSGKVKRWEQVGGVAGDIHVIGREEGKSTRLVIEGLLMGEDKFTDTMSVQISNEEQKKMVANDPLAIGFNPFAQSLDGSVKALAIDRVAATPENARNRSYPLVRPLYFLTKTAPAGLVKAFLDFAINAEGQKIIADAGYVPAH